MEVNYESYLHAEVGWTLVTGDDWFSSELEQVRLEISHR